MEERRVVGQVALYGAPIVAGLITAVVLLGPGRERAATGVRVYGTIVEGGSHFALRMIGMQHDENGYRAAPLAAMTVDLRVGGETVGTSEIPPSSSEVIDVEIECEGPLAGPAELHVSWPRRRLAIAVSPRPRLGTQAPTTLRQGSFSVVVPRGVLVPELPEAVKVTLADQELATEAPVLESRADGADVRQGKARRACGDTCVFQWDLELTARAPAVDLELRAGRAHWSAPLPITPGGLWVAPDAGDGVLRLRSATPREVAYVSLVAPTGRFAGFAVPMTTDVAGFASGEHALPSAMPAGPITALVSSEPTEPPEGTVAWPVAGIETIVGGDLALLADEMPSAIATESARRNAVRRYAYGLVLAAGLFELVHLGVRARHARRRLEEHLKERGASGAAAETPLHLAALLLVSGAVALAFAVLALLTAWG